MKKLCVILTVVFCVLVVGCEPKKPPAPVKPGERKGEVKKEAPKKEAPKAEVKEEKKDEKKDEAKEEKKEETKAGAGNDAKIEEAMKKSLEQMNKLGTIMATVKDEASSKKAITDLDAVVTALGKLKQEGKALGKPSEALEKKYDPEVEKATKKMTEEMERIMKLPIGAAFMKDYGEVMKKMGGDEGEKEEK